jgi:hypothetical protein
VNVWLRLRWLCTQVPRRGQRRLDVKRFPLTRFASFIVRALERRYGCVHVITAPAAPRPRKTDLLGLVVAEPDVRDTYATLRLHASKVVPDGGAPRAVEGKVLVRAPLYPEIRQGDQLRAYGMMETPPEYAAFSNRDYLA